MTTPPMMKKKGYCGLMAIYNKVGYDMAPKGARGASSLQTNESALYNVKQTR